MAIPKINEQDINKALKYIDEKGVPFHNQSTKYELVKDGKRYPPKYVVAVADHLANNVEISTAGFNAIEAQNFLETRGFNIGSKPQEKFELSITADSVESTDERFTMDDLTLGNNYEPLGVYFKKANGTRIFRAHSKNENKISNRTMPRLAFQVFAEQISALSSEDKENFPVSKFKSNSELVCGIYSSVDEYKKHRNSSEFVDYQYGWRRFVIYNWSIFSTIIFVQECLKRFGEPGDQFVLTYREKDERKTEQDYKNSISSVLIKSKNLIFHGAPGTGKTYLAKKIAADIASGGACDDSTELSDEEKSRIGFVQFHPSYDYTDFVEGLRPITKDGSVGFERRDGVLMEFVNRARENFENSKKLSAEEQLDYFLKQIELGEIKNDFYTKRDKTRFSIESVDKNKNGDDIINIKVDDGDLTTPAPIKKERIKEILESGEKFSGPKDVKKAENDRLASYVYSIYTAIKEKIAKPEKQKNFVFIIDEINRGEISKIFGELFFSIDPDYRGENGAVATQYANLHDNPDDKFYIPENVYIIGTMNDIDRSVDTFDFAMRRRFRFVEITADESIEMLEALGDEDLTEKAVKRMTNLNKAIANTEGLNENYQIGAAYFLKLKELGGNFDELWEDYLKPLLQEYVRGTGTTDEEKSRMTEFEEAYGYEGGTDDN